MKVLITGAAGGLGRAFVNECAKRGYEICAIDINESGLKNIKEGIKNRFSKDIVTFNCDITDDASIKSLGESLNELDFRPDMLLNVAGVDHEGGFTQREFNELNRIVELNISGTLRITHNVVSQKEKNKPLYIVFVSSLAAEQPIPLKATYAASKRFLLDFSYALGEELKEDNVKVLALCPGGLATKDDVIKAIEGQGFFGSVTTCNIEKVVTRTIDKVLKGRKKYVPGNFNKFTAILGSLIPINLTTKLLHKRWTKAQSTWLNN